VLRIRAGTVAATVSLPNGFDENPDPPRSGDWNKSRNILLFGSSDLLRIYSDQFDFDSRHSDVGRTINYYHAADLGVLHTPGAEGMFRALSFFRLQRPEYAHLTLGNLQTTLERFTHVSQQFNVECRALLGLGWADLYLDLSADELDTLFGAIASYRAVVLDDHAALFRNAFTVVGVDLAHVERAKASSQLVHPTISLRVAPSKLADVVQDYLPRFFPDTEWKTQITTGKRDLVISPHAKIPFSEFWAAHRDLRLNLGTTNRIYKVETHFDFPTDIITTAPPHAVSNGCACGDVSTNKTSAFMLSVTQCGRGIGRGLKQSLNGLAELYRDALQDRDSCCDFDAAAAHYYAQQVVIDEYRALSPESDTASFDRYHLLREAIERLDVSALVIFHQEQNGSYTDLLSRSERVSLYRGGMQKLTSVLLLTMDALIERHSLGITPMLCWWPAGQIQSERPISVIKVPVHYLNEPEVALFLIIHELGQLTAYHSRLRVPDDVAPTREVPVEGVIHVAVTSTDSNFTKDVGIDLPLGSVVDIPVGPRVSAADDEESAGRAFREYFADRAADTGKLFTDIFADVFLLRIGFNDDLSLCADFLLDQFLKLEDVLEMSPDGEKQAVQLFTRLIYTVIATSILRDPTANREVSLADVRLGREMVLTYFRGAARERLKLDSAAARLLLNSAVVDDATNQCVLWRRWLDVVVAKVSQYEREPAGGEVATKPGEIVPIETEQVVARFRQLLLPDGVPQDTLFLQRTGLLASVLTSLQPSPRLRPVTDAAL